MTPIRVFIAEDEPLAREALVAMVATQARWQVIGSADNGKLALEGCLAHEPDVLLTDIRMPLVDGLDIARALRDEHSRCLVVFVTAYDHHAVEAFRLAAVDYLLKPITRAELSRCLERVAIAVDQRRTVAAVEGGALDEGGLAALLRHPPEFAKRIVIRSPGRVDVVPIDDVVALRVERNYVDVVTAAHTWLHRETLKALLERLDPARFVQISRSVVVAVAKVRGIVRDGTAEILLDGGHRFAISRRFQLAVERALEQ